MHAQLFHWVAYGSLWCCDWNAVHFAAKEALSSIIDPLVIHGADIDQRSNAGETPLHIAAQNGSDEFAAALLSFGADVNAQDRTGATALHYAIEKGHFNVAKVLLKNGASQSMRNNAGQSAIDCAPSTIDAAARSFFQNWEDWDELVETVEFHGRTLQPQ
jgi:ankyrin repeat protein